MIQAVDAKERNDQTEEKERGTWLQARYLVAFSCSLINTVFYFMRINLSVAIVAIALETEEHDVTDVKYSAPQYDWSAVQRSTILSSFFWGYTAMQLPGVAAVHRLGSKRCVFLMAIMSSVVSILFVPASSLGWIGACVARILLGCSQAGLMASVHQLLSRWAPPEERSRMVVYAYCGQQIGIILAFAVSGILCEWIGWPSVFYLSGIMGSLVGVVWLGLVEDTPAKHRLASPHEKNLIEMSLASSIEQQQIRQRLKTPWKSILTSLPYLSLLITQCCQAWGIWTLLTGIPSYLNGVFGFDLTQDGLLSSLPYIAMLVTSFVFGWGADELLKRGFWSVEVSRKLGNSIGSYGSALMLVILSFVSSNPTIAMIILVIAVACNAGCLIGSSVNHLDLSPNFAASLMGVANTAACMMAIISPLLVGFVVTDNENADQWRIIFLITAGLYVLGNTLFLIFGTTNEQPWNNPDWKSTDVESEKGSR